MPKNREQFKKEPAERPAGPEPSPDSSERSLEMARPKRGRQEQVKLTEEQDKQLLDIIVQAREAERKGELQKAIDLYSQYEKEFLSIKGEQDKEKREGKSQSFFVEDEKGEEREIDLEQLRQKWISFYREHNLQELADALPETITLTEEQIEQIKEKAKEGFDKLILFPSIEIQSQHLQAIKEETEKPLEGLKDDQQYKKETYFSDLVKSAFPDKIKTRNRPENRPYLLFTKDIPEPEQETRGLSPDQIRPILEAKAETGFTLSEYLIFQREYVGSRKTEDQPHPETEYYTWLLDSEIKEEGGAAGVLKACWHSGSGRVGADSHLSYNRFSGFGSRSSAIFEISE